MFTVYLEARQMKRTPEYIYIYIYIYVCIERERERERVCEHDWETQGDTYLSESVVDCGIIH